MNNTISIKLSLDAFISKEKPGMYVSHCPALDLYSQGKTQTEAEKNIVEATHLFIDSCLARNTLPKVLEDCGFYLMHKNAKRKPKLAPKLKDKHIRQIRFPAEVPVLAWQQ